MYKERLGTYRKNIKIRNKAFTKKETHSIIITKPIAQRRRGNEKNI